jgi:hypothetical protein
VPLWLQIEPAFVSNFRLFRALKGFLALTEQTILCLGETPVRIMAARRNLYRKEKPRSISKTGLLLCLLLAGGVMLVPVGANLIHAGKLKLRDAALQSGLIDFDDCVVTAGRQLACNSHADGTPLPVALRQIADSAAEAATEKEQRLHAESQVRTLTMDIERLNAQLRRAELAATAGSFLAPLNGDVRPTGLAVTNPGTGSVMTPGAEPQPANVSQAEPGAPAESAPDGSAPPSD